MTNRKTVLLVEDEAAVERFLTQLLSKAGWHVQSTRSGEEALQFLRRGPVDIILCDLDLGAGLNGIELLATIRRDGVATPLVILTGHGTMDRCNNAWRLGAADFLEKPSPPQEILSVLGRLAGLEAEPNRVDQPALNHEFERAEHRYIRLGLAAIDKRFRDPDLSVPEIARAAEVSADYLGRLFQRHLGRSVLAELERRRIGEAKKLLSNPRVSVYEAALESGHRSTKVLADWFNRIERCSPTAWRTRAGNPLQAESVLTARPTDVLGDLSRFRAGGGPNSSKIGNKE